MNIDDCPWTTMEIHALVGYLTPDSDLDLDLDLDLDPTPINSGLCLPLDTSIFSMFALFFL